MRKGAAGCVISETTFKVKPEAEEGKEESAVGKGVEGVEEGVDLTLIEG